MQFLNLGECMYIILLYMLPRHTMLIIEGTNVNLQAIKISFLHYSHSEPLVWAHISFGQMLNEQLHHVKFILVS